MFVALGFLLGLIALCAAIPFVDGGVLSAFVPLLVAGGLMLASLQLPPDEAQRFGVLAKPLAIGAAVPAIWILLQMAPLPFSSWAHPVWASVKAGFPGAIAGSISVDIGASALALARYLALVGAFLLALALTISRERAEAVLTALCAATSLVSLIAIGLELFGAPANSVREETASIACLGVVLAACCVSFVFERHETRRSKLGFANPKFVYPIAASLVAFLICAAAVGLSRSGSLIFAASCGLGVFLAFVVVRRLNLGRWGAGPIGATGAVIIIALISGATGGSSDARLTFVKKDAATVELTQRILADTPLFGDGAGTFSSLLPIYQFADSGEPEARAATAAAQLSIEMGRIVLWSAVIAALLGAAWLILASSQRGRDSFFSAAAAANLVMFVILAFVNVSLFGAALPLLAALALGLGVAQSQGRG